MQRRGDAEQDGVELDGAEHLGEGTETVRDAELGRGSAGFLQIGIAQGREGNREKVQSGEDVAVGVRADADQADAEFFLEVALVAHEGMLRREDGEAVSGLPQAQSSVNQAFARSDFLIALDLAMELVSIGCGMANSRAKGLYPMDPIMNRKPDKERLKAALLHQKPDVTPYWEGLIGKRNLEFLFGRPNMPELSWFLPTEDQITIARLTGQDAIAGGGFYAAPRVREKDGTVRAVKNGELTSWEMLERLVPYSDDDVRALVRWRLEENLQKVEGTGIGIYVGCGGALWQSAWQLVGFDEFMMKMVTEPEFIKTLIDTMGAPAVKAGELFAEYPLTFLLVGDNISTTKGPFVHPDSFKPLWVPWVTKMIAPAKERGIPVFLNTDGKIDWILDDFVEMGVDALNPIDPNGNDIFEVKAKYGEKFCLVGGIDQHWPLATGTPEDVDRAVKECIERLSGGGGFIPSSSHDIGENVPPENWVAMMRAIEKYG
jgi:uroporphyrinogen decarboxylase